MIRKARIGVALALVIGILAACSTAPRSREGKDDLVRQAAAALTAWNTEVPGVEGYARWSYGYALFPEIAKGGIGIGAGYGRGVVYAQGQHIGYADLSQGSLGLLLRQLRNVTDATDGQVLERFAIDRDEVAFRELVRRHGPLVWAVVNPRRTTRAAAAGGYCSTAMSSNSAATIEAEPPPLMIFTTKKSPITMDSTKIEPSAMPLRLSGTMMVRMMSSRLAPASSAASTVRLSILAMALKIGTIMKSV